MLHGDSLSSGVTQCDGPVQRFRPERKNRQRRQTRARDRRSALEIADKPRHRSAVSGPDNLLSRTSLVAITRSVSREHPRPWHRTANEADQSQTRRVIARQAHEMRRGHAAAGLVKPRREAWREIGRGDLGPLGERRRSAFDRHGHDPQLRVALREQGRELLHRRLASRTRGRTRPRSGRGRRAAEPRSNRARLARAREQARHDPRKGNHHAASAAENLARVHPASLTDQRPVPLNCGLLTHSSEN